MPNVLWVLVTLGGCDDTWFPPGGNQAVVPDDYTADWPGVKALFRDQCETCHGHAAGNPSLTLPDDVETDLRNHAGVWVVPGYPDQSKLWRVISGNLNDTDLIGVMPLGSGPLNPALTAHVKVWITNGAPLDGGTDTDTSDTDGPADTDTDTP